MNICFISCGAAKMKIRCTAANMYIGSVFLKSKFYAEEMFDEYFILSAKHGLLSRKQKISPYNEKLTTKNQKEWSLKVAAQINESFGIDSRLSFLGGDLYLKQLFPLIKNKNKEILFGGLQMGEKMQRINELLGIADQWSGGGVISEIIFLFEEGFTRQEIISMGFNKSTVGRQISEYQEFKQSKLF